jgi:hypothetical protein
VALRIPNRLTTFRERRRDSPREAFNPQAESRATRTVWIPWASREEAVADILGYTTVETDAALGTKYFSRANPWRHPDWKGWPLYAADISEIVGEIPQGRSPDDVGAFDEGRATVSFTTRNYDVREDVDVIDPGGVLPTEAFLLRNVEVTERPIVHGQSIPGGQGLRWASDARPALLATFVPVHLTSLTLVWRQVPVEGYRERQDPGDPTSSLGFFDLVGCANNGDFGHVDSVFGLKPAGTVSQGAPSRQVVKMGNGRRAYDVTVPYTYHPYGANYYFRHDKPGGPGYDRIERPDGSLLFPLKDLSQAFEAH